MAWTANITNKEMVNGVVNVTIQFSDGVRTVTETFRSGSPTETWIPDTVRNRLVQIESASAFDVAIGPATPSVAPAKDDAVLFRNRVQLLVAVRALIDLGVVKADNAQVVAMEDWVKANFETYFGRL